MKAKIKQACGIKKYCYPSACPSFAHLLVYERTISLQNTAAKLLALRSAHVVLGRTAGIGGV